MNSFGPACTLRRHRALLLAMEAVGWLHMTGKARREFLYQQGGQNTGYKELRWHEQETPQFPWHDLLEWVKKRFGETDGVKVGWPDTLADFLTKHRERDGKGILGLLQAAHGMASGIEKNLPSNTSKYLGQDVTHMWLSSVFGHPVQHLVADPPEVLADAGWGRLLTEIQRLLEKLGRLGVAGSADVEIWRCWRESAAGTESFLRRAFSSTLAETRLPNNDVTLWDQSYVAAALFKSAVAGGILEGASFPWNDKLKQTTRWRLLTVGIGADHYEARAVRILDWVGARRALGEFFGHVRRLVEVDLAVGSLLYSDGAVCVFSFPGERDGVAAGISPLQHGDWQQWLLGEVDAFAKELKLETPPYCRISSEPTRALVPMVAETQAARAALALPLHRRWDVSLGATHGHVCPVCLVRHNGNRADKQVPCTTCGQRRRGRRDSWLGGEPNSDTIWISEVADSNDRLALVTLSLDLEPWLGGRISEKSVSADGQSTRLDALRAQAAAEWRRHNPQLSPEGKARVPNQIDLSRPFESLVSYVREKLAVPCDGNDPVLRGLHEGYQHERDWPTFFKKVVEDRSNAPDWDTLGDNDHRARWLVHQFFRKLASPGRVHRFWHQAETFFVELLDDFRKISACEANRWRVRRVILRSDARSAGEGWTDREVYNGRWRRDAPVSLLYLRSKEGFVTVCNLARLLAGEDDAGDLQGAGSEGIELALQGEDGAVRKLRVGSVKTDTAELGVYQPVIPLELSPTRFRVLVPLEAASACVDRAMEAWNEHFARVWDRLPLRVGVVAFPRMVPFQAVIEAARTLENTLLADVPASEVWRVVERDAREGVVALGMKRVDGGTELRTVPVTLPDGRTDVFYPYVAVEDEAVRFPFDFQHPDGQVYRHILDLRPGDGVGVCPSRVGTVFLDTTGRRFEELHPRALAEWSRMRQTWRLVERAAPSTSALHGAWAELAERWESWRCAGGGWAPGGRQAWADLARAVLGNRLKVQGAALDALVQAAEDGVLEWALDWHLSVLKTQITEASHAG